MRCSRVGGRSLLLAEFLPQLVLGFPLRGLSLSVTVGSASSSGGMCLVFRSTYHALFFQNIFVCPHLGRTWAFCLWRSGSLLLRRGRIFPVGIRSCLARTWPLIRVTVPFWPGLVLPGPVWLVCPGDVFQFFRVWGCTPAGLAEPWGPRCVGCGRGSAFLSLLVLLGRPPQVCFYLGCPA